MSSTMSAGWWQTGPSQLPNYAPDPRPVPSAAATVNPDQVMGGLFPGWPVQLRELLLSFWDQYGDMNVALALVRQSPEYDQWVPGNRNTDGTVRLPEGEYFSRMEGYAAVTARWGINPDLLRSKFVELIRGNVTPGEWADRVRHRHEQLLEWGPTETNFYSMAQRVYGQYFGVEMNDAAVLLSTLDPAIGEEIVQKRIRLAQIGAGAAAYGFARDRGTAERLASFGLTGETALDFYSQARQQLPTLQGVARRQNDPGVNVSTLEHAFVERDAGTQQRLARNVGGELADWSRPGGFRQDQEGRLAGLRPR